MTEIAQLVRGDTFQREFTLASPWLGSSFTGGVKWTMRRSQPSTATVDDSDAVHQSSVANGEITFVGDVGTILIPASVTTAWDARSYCWDLQGVIDGAPQTVYTIDSGRFRVTGDITRSI